MTGSLDETPAPPKVGDRVRVTVEGTVSEHEGGDTLWLSADDPRYGGQRFNPNWPYVVSVEVLTPPAPTWWPPTPGDVARVWNSTYLRQHDNGEGPAWVNAAGAHLTDDAVLRLIRDTHADVGFDPPALLIRGGKAQP